jgi:hypothetical protein
MPEEKQQPQVMYMPPPPPPGPAAPAGGAVKPFFPLSNLNYNQYYKN